MDCYQLSNVCKDSPQADKLIAYWLGGAGFVFKFDDNTTICIDPYLSDSAERLFGFKRLTPAPIKAEQLKYDCLLLTHEHGDHLDIDIFEILTKNNSSSIVIASESCQEYISKHTSNYTITSPGLTHNINNIKIESVKSDHGELSPKSLGFIIHFAGRKIYFTGDTALNRSIMDPIIKLQPEIVIPCINGAYGNMDERESAELVAQSGAEIAIPMHYGMFNEHGGDAELFKKNLAEINPEIRCMVLEPGQGVQI